MKPRLLILLILIIGFTGCDQIIDYAIPVEKPVPVVNAIITPDSVFSINLTGSHHVLDDNYDFQSLEGFEVKVLIDGVFLGEAEFDNTNYTLEGYYPEYGRKYSLEISKEGIPTVSAEDNIPLIKPEFSILSYRTKEQDYYLSHIFDLEIDNPPKETFFEIVVYSYNYSYDYSNNGGPPMIIDSSYFALPVSTDNPIAQNSSDYYGSQSLLFSNKLIDTPKFQFAVSVDYIPFRYGSNRMDTPNEVDIVVRIVSENYFYYKKSFRLQQESQGDPLAEPVIVFNNIENGLGNFSAYVQSKESYMVPFSY